MSGALALFLTHDGEGFYSDAPGLTDTDALQLPLKLESR
jgi:hypothetical protein